MPLVSGQIPSAIQGVSQQPASVRLPSQCEAAENVVFSEAEGVIKRPPCEFIGVLNAGPYLPGAKYWHEIVRQGGDSILLAVGRDGFRTYDLDGNLLDSLLITDDATLDPKLTLNSILDAKTAFRAVTVADTTFVVNRQLTPAMDATLSTARDPEALVVVKQGNYGKTYRIQILDKSTGNILATAAYTAPNGGSASDQTLIDTTYIAGQLVTDAIANNFASTYNVTPIRYGHVIHLSWPTDIYTIAVEDGFGGNAMTVFQEKTQRFSDLPNRGPEGFHLEIVGDDTNAFDNYYVEFRSRTDGGAGGVWSETIAQGVEYQFDDDTMPTVIQIDPVTGVISHLGTYWSDRAVGDTESSPDPSFIGQKISDVFFYRDRLGFVVDEGVVCSRAGQYESFWRQTATDVLDDDPIDITVTTSEYNELHSASQFAEELLVFSDKGPFALRGGDLLTPRTARLDPQTSYLNDRDVRPRAAGSNVYFVSERGGYSQVTELYVDDALRAQGSEVTRHVPRYIPSDLTVITPGSSEETLVCHSETNGHQMYVYKWLLANREKLQSAWGRWSLHPDHVIDYSFFVNSTLYAVVARRVSQDDTIRAPDLVKFDLAPGAQDDDVGFKFCLDYRVSSADCTVTLLPASGSDPERTLFEFPRTGHDPAYDGDGDDYVQEEWQVVTTSGGASAVGLTPQVLERTAYSVTVIGDLTAQPCYIGYTYAAELELSDVHIQRQGRGGQILPIVTGRLMMKYMTVNVARTGYFSVEVAPKGSDSWNYEYTGVQPGDPDFVFGEPPVAQEDTFRFAVQAQNTEVDITLRNDTYLPSIWQSMEWEGFYVKQAR